MQGCQLWRRVLWASVSGRLEERPGQTHGMFALFHTHTSPYWAVCPGGARGCPCHLSRSFLTRSLSCLTTHANWCSVRSSVTHQLQRSVQTPAHSQPLSRGQANWDWIAASVWILGVFLKDFPDKSITNMSVGDWGILLSWTPCGSSPPAREDTGRNPAVTQELGQKFCREKVHLCLQELQQQSLGFFSTLVFSLLLPLRASLLHFLSPQTYQQYGNVWKTLLLQMLPQPCQHWQCKGILHGGSRGCLCWTQILLTGSLQGKAEREIAPSCWNQTGIELNHIYSSGGKFLELLSHRMPGLSWKGS